jgi:mono/diheme cytochrome c family protein
MIGVGAAAQGPGKTVADGVYTADQAKRGAMVYADQCAACHGENLEGNGAMPPLAGEDFAKMWSGRTVAELFEKTHSTMPMTAPGTLTEQQTADVVAYMLQVGTHPAGTTELPPSMEPLKAKRRSTAPSVCHR